MTRFSETAVTLLIPDAGARVVIPPTLTPTVDFGSQSDAVLPIYSDSAEVVGDAMLAGRVAILDWIGPSSAWIALRGSTSMTWEIDGDDSGWFYSDSPTFRQVAEAIRAIPQVHTDLNNPEIDLATVVFMLASRGQSVGTATVTVEFADVDVTSVEELPMTYRYVTTPVGAGGADSEPTNGRV